MGLDLKILPQYNQNTDFSHDIISLHRDSDLFEIISELEDKTGKEVPKEGIYTYSGESQGFDEPCYGATINTGYGRRMKSVLAKDLKNILLDYKSSSWKNEAFIAFLNELPDKLPIWLYWH